MTPIDEGRKRSQGTANRGRVQTPSASNIRLPGLRPSASPVDTYARPEQAPIGSNGWESLAKALSGIQPEINAFLNTRALEQTEPQDADFAEARRQLALQPTADARMKAIRDGKIPALTTVAGRQVAGERLAYDRSVRLMEEYQTSFDKGSGDVDQFIQERIKDDLERYQGDPIFMAAYMKQVDGLSDRLRGQAVDDRAKYEMEKREGDVFGKWSAKADFDLAEKKAPADVATGIFGEFQTNRDMLRIPFDRQQEMALQMANQAATAGKLDLARAILSHERSDGPYKGSLLTDAKLGQQATAILDRIDTEQQKINLKQTAAEAEEQLGEALDGSWERGEVRFVSTVTIPNERGEAQEIKPEKAEEMAVKRALARSQVVAAERGETKEQTETRELAEFTGNAVKHPEWFRVMDAGASAATVPNVSLDSPPDVLIQGYDKYKTLYGKAPVYVEQHLNAKAADFYEMVRVGEELGWDQRLAMSVAMRANAPGASKDEATQRVQFQKLNIRVSDLVADKKVGGFLGFGGTAPINEGTVKTELNRYAQLYVKLGLGEDEAIERAAQRLDKNYFNFNGTLIKRDSRMPPNFEGFADTAINEFVLKHGDKLDGADAGDLSLLPDGTSTGSWIIWNPSTNKTYSGRDFPDGVITYRSMAAAKQAERTRAEAEVSKKDAEQKQKPTGRHLFRRGG
ncbi:hypothetical protein [Ensifer sp. YR511]|uniref:hypothetical protein n=1 Tax=Ensifer sp. YR511 TaxID=1855294 RepID=UPI00115FC878|nr:hypothetical protein [Ensifer sp. YR511]